MKKLLGLLLLLVCSSAWAQVPISGLPAATTSTTGVEIFPVVQPPTSGTTKKMTLLQIQTWLESVPNMWDALATFSGSAPGQDLVYFNNTSNGAGLKNWSMRVGSTGAFTIDPLTDGLTHGSNSLLSANKNGATNALTLIILGNSTDLPAINLYGNTTITGLTGQEIFGLSSTGAASTFDAGWNVGISSTSWNLFTNSTDNFALGTTGNAALNLYTNTLARIAINGAGNVSVQPATSGSSFGSTGAAGNYAAHLSGSSTTGQSYGLDITAGTNSSDFPLVVANQAGTTGYFEVRGDGAISGLGPTAAALVDMTPDQGTFAITAANFASGGTGTGKWKRMGNIVVLFIPILSGTSNGTAFNFTLPSAIQPTTSQFVAVPNGQTEDNGANVTDCSLQVNGTQASFYHNFSATGWTAAGVKFTGQMTVTYMLN